MSLVERWRPRKAVCAVWYKERKTWKGTGKEAHSEEIIIFFQRFLIKLLLWVSSLPSLLACIMGATPHILRKSERETDWGRVFPRAMHLSTWARALQRMFVHQWADVLASSFTCQVHFLSLFEHHVTAGASSAGRMVVLPSSLWGQRRGWGVTVHKLSS